MNNKRKNMIIKRIVVVMFSVFAILGCGNTVNAAVIDGGTGDDDLTWEVAADGKDIVLTISGTDYMNNDSSEIMPWSEYKSSITKVNIDEGVCSIGRGAFKDFTNLTSITIPSTIETVSKKAFYGCTKLESVIWERTSCGSTYIDSRAFANCTKLETVVLPEKLYAIGECAFYNCVSLTDINLPAGLKTIEDAAFYNCTSLINISLPEDLIRIEEEAFINCSKLLNCYCSHELSPGCSHELSPDCLSSCHW